MDPREELLDDMTLRRLADAASKMTRARIGPMTIRAALVGRRTLRTCAAVRAALELAGFYVPLVSEDER